MREGIFFFRSFYEVGQKLTPKDRLAYYDAILGYAFEDIDITNLKGFPEIAFISAKPVLDADKQKYLNGQKAAGFGKLGGRPKKENNPGGFSKNNPEGFEKEKGTENPLNNKNKNIKQEQEQEQGSSVAKATAPSGFVKPTIEDVAAYAASLHYTGFNAERFMAYYESNGWKVGKNPMRSWKGAVVNWHAREQSEQSYSKPIKRADNIHNLATWEQLQKEKQNDTI